MNAMAPKTKWAAWAEYAALRGALAALSTLPPRAAARAADRIGDLAYALDRRHRAVALANVRRTIGRGLPDAEVRRIVRGAFRNFARVAYETHGMERFVARRGLDDVVRVEGAEHVRRALAEGRGALVVSAHLGNWEVIAAAGAPLGMALTVVGRRMDNPLLGRFLERRRSAWALEVIPKEGGAGRIVRALKQGRCVALLVDQHAGRHGVVVDFLGLPASTHRTPAELALRLGVPILAGFGIRLDDRPTFRLEFDPPIFAPPVTKRRREEAVRDLTQRLTRAVERRVRAHPEQWNWLHRRWRIDGAGGRPAPALEEATP